MQTSTRGTLDAWQAVLVGVAGAVVGLLPWAIGGMRLPLQNLWRDDTPAEQMPLALLPFSQYAVAELIAMIGVGSVIAGLVARRWAPRLGRAGIRWVGVGVVGLQGIAFAQTVAVVLGGLRSGLASFVYVGGLTAVALAAVLLGLLAYALVAGAPPAGALVGLTLGAIALSFWMPTLLEFGSSASVAAGIVRGLVEPLGPALMGVAIAWCGLRGGARIAATVGSLALLWVLPAALDGARFALGSRALLPYPAELLDAFLHTAGQTLTAGALRGVAVAAGVAAVGLVARALVGRRA
ncbi:MAG: hypothetical protein QM713_12160 [Arachnia sp.]